MKQQINLLHFNYSWLSLTEAWLYNLIRFLPPDIQSQIVCKKMDNSSSFDLPGIQIGSVGRALKFSGAHILHSHFADFGWRNMNAAEQAGVKHVVSFYGHEVCLLPLLDPDWNARFHDMFARVDAVLCEGEHMAQCIIEDLGCPPEKLYIHRLGVDLERLPYRPRTWTIGEPLRILIAGSFREKKGIPYALEAVAKIRKEIPNVTITIIGDAGPTSTRMAPVKNKIMSTMKDKQLIEHTTLLGFQPHHILVQEAYRHHLFLSPSFTADDGETEGGAPVTIIEMAATGMPVISTTHCDIPGTLGLSNKELLVGERDVDGLAQAIIRLTQMPSWDQLLSENRRHIEQNFSASGQGCKLAAIYRSLL